MNDDENLWGVKRGRPRKIKQLDWLKFQISLKDKMKVISPVFKELQSQYIFEHYNQSLLCMIRNIVSLLKVPLKLKHKPLLFIIEEAVKQMMVNKVELSLFCKLIIKVNLRKLDISLEDLVKLCLYSSKLVFESDEVLLHYFRSNLIEEMPYFEDKLGKYASDNHISTKGIARIYKRIKKIDSATINYSYYVDEIIRTSPPYKLSKNNQEENEWSLKKFELETALDDIYLPEEVVNMQCYELGDVCPTDEKKSKGKIGASQSSRSSDTEIKSNAIWTSRNEDYYELENIV